jgi:hypothetical protein
MWSICKYTRIPEHITTEQNIMCVYNNLTSIVFSERSYVGRIYYLVTILEVHNIFSPIKTWNDEIREDVS